MFTRPNRITDTMRFGGVYTLADGAIVLILVLYGFGTLGDLVYPPLRLWFKICLGAITLFWMMPSPLKPGQKNITTLVDLLKKDLTIYVPDSIYIDSKEAFLDSQMLEEETE